MTEPQAENAGGAVPPFPETADIETSNDDYATRFCGKVGAWMLGMQERGVLKLLAAAVPRGAAVLDVGGGHGQLAEPLCREALDIFRAALRKAAPALKAEPVSFFASA